MDILSELQQDIQIKIGKGRVNFKKSPKERLTKSYVETRLENLESQWSLFNETHRKIVEQHSKADILKSDYGVKNVYDETEELYIDYKSELKDKLSKFELSVASSSSVEQPVKANSCNIKLPKISIAPFSGKYSEWPAFRDLFVSLIHNNISLDDVQKLHYLKAHLTGEAEQLLRHIPITSDNYKESWFKLEERYNNKRFLASSVLKRLLSQKNLTIESSSLIKDLLDTTSECLNALKGLGIDISTWDIIIIHIICLKLDLETRKKWELSLPVSEELPCLEDFKAFLTNRYRALEFLDSKYYRSNSKGHQACHVINYNKKNIECQFCNGDHKLSFCKKFASENREARRNFVQDNGICFNCLGNNHSVKFCKNPIKCQICKRRHHSLLHPENISERSQLKAVTSSVVGESSQSTNTVTPSESLNKPVTSCFSTGEVNKTVLLPTAIIEAESRDGTYRAIRALLDQGSQASFVTEATVQYLGLKKIPSKQTIKGIGENKGLVSKSVVMLKAKSRIDPSFVIKVRAYVLKSITSLLPVIKINATNWVDINVNALADPEYHTPNKIDVLLGAEIYPHILKEGIIKDPQGLLIAQATSLGWILSGIVDEESTLSSNIVVLHTHVSENDLLKKFWELEAEPENKKTILTEEEKQCEDLFMLTTRRDEEGRYIVRLPFRNTNPALRNEGSRDIAEKRFKALESKLKKNENLKKDYVEVINGYLQLNHMKKVSEREKNNKKAVYLPHHAVVKEEKDTTKVRVVFDASCKGRNGTSLNDMLMIGPTLQDDLRHIIMRWRVHPISLVADIIKMYRQIKVDRRDTVHQRILWRDDPEKEIAEFELMTVTFGTASAPYLAVRALQQVAYDEGQAYPLAAKKVVNDFYMDDLMTGAENIEEAVKIYNEMNKLLNKAGFKLQKWSSNSMELLNEINKGVENKVSGKDETLNFKLDTVIKILGLTWNRCDDTFQYVVTIPAMKEPVTKRAILSDIAKLYDPLGWAGPCVITAKILIQKLWLTGIDWDDEVPTEILKEWLTYRGELKMLNNIKLPRWMSMKFNDRKFELHGFSDASKLAYSAVIYVRVIDAGGKIHVTLVTAKTKVAPIKQVSIPRLELCGAVLLTRLMTEVAKVLKVDKHNLFAWTDSEVVLAWINSHPSRWKTFIANRVSEILTTFDADRWSHVQSKYNPADCASRGIKPSEMSENTLWLNGPSFLMEKELLFHKPKYFTTRLEEIKTHTVTIDTTIWNKFSSLNRLIRVIAYCRRFLKFRKPISERNCSTYLNREELVKSMDICIQHCQNEEFLEEIKCCKSRSDLPKRNKLKSLNFFLDDKGILRVGGRLEQSQFDYDQKHPIIIPKRSFLTNLLLADAHSKTLHGGSQLMQNYLMSKYWILGLKQLTRDFIRKCVKCARHNALIQSQLMGQLPAARVTAGRPFKKSGVDYAGPINIRTSKGRGYHSYKGYICLFVCMATRAIHLEAVSDLTSQAFLAAFKRFVARRGHCSDLYSDNGSNFVGAARELKMLLDIQKSKIAKDIAEWLSNNGTDWHFIPPHAPNFGGLWEAGIKSTKHHLKRVMGNSTLTFEELSTVLYQIEACLNSRPLSKIQHNVQEPVVLTPGHFLVGEPLLLVPDANYHSSNISTLRRWQLTQRMLQDFWKRWSQEYLTQFLQRYKWTCQNPEPEIGDIVLVKEDDLPPGRWLLAKVVEKHAGLDKITRVVSLRTKNSLIKRATNKLCVLPIAQ